MSIKFLYSTVNIIAKQIRMKTNRRGQRVHLVHFHIGWIYLWFDLDGGSFIFDLPSIVTEDPNDGVDQEIQIPFFGGSAVLNQQHNIKLIICLVCGLISVEHFIYGNSDRICNAYQ